MAPPTSGLAGWLRSRRRAGAGAGARGGGGGASPPDAAASGDDSPVYDSDAALEYSGAARSAARSASRSVPFARAGSGGVGVGGGGGSSSGAALLARFASLRATPPSPPRALAFTPLALDGDAPPADASAAVRPGFAWCAATAVAADQVLLRSGFGGVRGATLAGVFDGHGVHGRAAACAAAAAFAAALEADADRALARERAVRAAAFEAAADAAHAAVVAAVPDASLSGTTACVVLHTPDGGVAVANVGDSRAVLGRVADDDGRPEAVRLTRDHTPDDEAERQRIMRAGGSVRQARDARGAADGPHRVYGRSPADRAAGRPGLAMSRSLGDLASHALGVTHAPSVRVHAPGDGDLCVIVATDGVWGALSPADAVALVAGVRLAPVDGLTPADAITLEAHERWKGGMAGGSVDDVAAVVLHLCEPPLAAARPRPPPPCVTPGWPDCDAANSDAAVGARCAFALAPPARWFDAALAAGARDAGGCASSAAGSEGSSAAAAAAAAAAGGWHPDHRWSSEEAEPAAAARAPTERGGETLRAGRARARPAAGRYDRADSPEAADVAFRGGEADAAPPLPPLATATGARAAALAGGAPPSPASRMTARMSRPTPIPEDAPALTAARAVTAPRPVHLPRVVKAYPTGGGGPDAASAPGGLSLLAGRARSRSLSGSWLAFGSAGSLGASLGGVAGSAGSLALSAASSDDDGLAGAAAGGGGGGEDARARRWRAGGRADAPSPSLDPGAAPSSGESEGRVHGGGWARAASSGSLAGIGGWDGPASAPVTGWSLASPRSGGGGSLGAGGGLAAAARVDEEEEEAL